MSLMIEGGRRLSGDLTVQGAKNSVLPILAACILSGDVCVLQRCPHLEDVDTSIDILRHLGCAVRWNGPDLEVDSSTLTRWDIPDRLKRRMRSSVVFLGAILARCGQAECRPTAGGCELHIPVQMHMVRREQTQLDAICGAELSEPAEQERAPSLVLRRMAPGETLWDVAKQYRTREELIRGANRLEEDDDHPAGMLLIPRAR